MIEILYRGPARIIGLKPKTIASVIHKKEKDNIVARFAVPKGAKAKERFFVFDKRAYVVNSLIKRKLDWSRVNDLCNLDLRKKDDEVYAVVFSGTGELPKAYMIFTGMNVRPVEKYLIYHREWQLARGRFQLIVATEPYVEQPDGLVIDIRLLER